MSVKSVLITGTTSGVGRALLEHYSRAGASVISVNRRRVHEFERRYPSVRFECVDVRYADHVARLVSRLDRSKELPEVFILNAGINRIDNDQTFQLAMYREVVDTNLYGVLNFIEPITKLPATREPRHVIAISSMANYVGNPYGLGYHTSKRALTACFETWSKMYFGTDLVFQQVMLGPVSTAIDTIADKCPAWMVHTRDVFSGSLEGAVCAISRLALSRKKKLFYPWQAIPLYAGIRLTQSLVPAVFQGRRTLDGKPRRAKAR